MSNYGPMMSDGRTQSTKGQPHLIVPFVRRRARRVLFDDVDDGRSIPRVGHIERVEELEVSVRYGCSIGGVDLTDFVIIGIQVQRFQNV